MNLDRAADRVNDAAKLDNAPVGGALNDADEALLGPQDEIFGTANQFGSGDSTVSTTFDFRFRGDLLLGVIGGFDFDIIVNGVQVFTTYCSVTDNVIDLGSNFGTQHRSDDRWVWRLCLRRRGPRDGSRTVDLGDLLLEWFDDPAERPGLRQRVRRFPARSLAASPAQAPTHSIASPSTTAERCPEQRPILDDPLGAGDHDLRGSVARRGPGGGRSRRLRNPPPGR